MSPPASAPVTDMDVVPPPHTLPGPVRAAVPGEGAPEHAAATILKRTCGTVVLLVKAPARHPPELPFIRFVPPVKPSRVPEELKNPLALQQTSIRRLSVPFHVKFEVKGMSLYPVPAGR